MIHHFQLHRLDVATFTPALDAISMIDAASMSHERIADASAAICKRCEALGDHWNVGVMFAPSGGRYILVAPYWLGIDQAHAAAETVH